MELNRANLILGMLAAIGFGAGAAWWTREPAQPARARTAESTPAAESNKPSVVYKWQDDSGVWNFTDQPPANRPYEEVRGTPNVTSVPTVVPEVPHATAAGETIPPPPQ
jgi:Domain of unknown function (DUF4124)